MKKKIFVAALTVCTVALGFIRDYIFVSINQIIEKGGGVGWNLSVLKWVLTVLFSLLYMGSACAFIFILFQSKKYIWTAVIVYGVLFLVSFIVLFFGYFFSSFENTYPFNRTVMGIAQSPVVMMILISACYLEIKVSGR